MSEFLQNLRAKQNKRYDGNRRQYANPQYQDRRNGKDARKQQQAMAAAVETLSSSLSENLPVIKTILEGISANQQRMAQAEERRAHAEERKAEVLEKQPQGRCLLRLKTEKETEKVLNAIGFPPLPPYIKRDDDPKLAQMDKQRYQTVYAQHSGAVAAPTAGLHFTEPLIEQLKQVSIHFAYITLHIGAGTFKPVTTENLDDHQIHREKFSIDKENARIINTAKSKGGRIIPVGTTSTRTIESIVS